MSTPPQSSTSRAPEAVAVPGPDPHSYARPDQVRVRHVDLDWDLSFAQRALAGRATYRIERVDPAAPLVLDTRELTVESVSWAPAEGAFQGAEWSLGPADPRLGQSLTVALPEPATRVRVVYRAGASDGLQWLDPAQTSGAHPFLYSQSQAILARTFWPCQDSPGVRTTFDATVRVDRDLRVVMSAEDHSDRAARPADRTYRFHMPQPVPSYLVAIAAGDLEFRDLGPRSGVWAEPAVLERAAWELADTEKMIAAAEQLYGPYRWGRYDVLILPPAFPFGGMENPRLTFATPTILAGDRSLVSLVAHELAHSWSGNLVTNATWADLWLNEGFTTYFERRLVEALYGPERAEMEASLGLADLRVDFADVAADPAAQHLRRDLSGHDPDDGMNAVPYDKGALLLRTLERAWGRERFDAFLQAWFEQHAFTSVTTDDFLAELGRAGGAPEGVDVRAWIDGPGIPDGAALPSTPAFEAVDRHVAELLAGKARVTQLPVKGWSPQEWIHFLQRLDGRADPKLLARLDEAFGLTRTGNAEVLAVWLRLSIGADYGPAMGRLEEFLTRVGRRKFLTPLYKALVARGPDGAKRARAIYGKARAGYHSLARDVLDEVVGWSAG